MVFAPAAIVIASGVLSFVALRRSLATRDSLIHTRDVLDASSSLLLTLLDAETAERGYLVTGDTTFLQPLVGASVRTDTMLFRLDTLTAADSIEHSWVVALGGVANRGLALTDTVVSLERSGRHGVAVRLTSLRHGKEVMDQTRGLISSMQAEEARLLEFRQRQEGSTRHSAAIIIVAGTVIAALLAFLINRSFDRALNDRRVALQDLQLAHEQLQDQAHELEQQADAAHRAALEADAANRAKAAFLAAMSHELRTPLQAALGFAQLVRDGMYGPITSEQADVLERIERSQEHLARLIDDILDFARLEAGRVRIDREPVPLASVIAETIDIVGGQAVDKGIALTAAPTPRELVVSADRRRLQQILVNLIGNAIKFTPVGGTIRVASSAADGHAMVDVRDTGTGIPADRLQAIFEPFVQVDNSLTRAHTGTGLGLAISRDLARAMHGDITVASEMGKGSIFTVQLPLAADGARTADVPGLRLGS